MFSRIYQTHRIRYKIVRHEVQFEINASSCRRNTRERSRLNFTLLFTGIVIVFIGVYVSAAGAFVYNVNLGNYIAASGAIIAAIALIIGLVQRSNKKGR